MFTDFYFSIAMSVGSGQIDPSNGLSFLDALTASPSSHFY